jgi:hypothetical protein
VAKEQRLKYLKQQEYQQHQMASEYDKLRRYSNFVIRYRYVRNSWRYGNFVPRYRYRYVRNSWR